MIVVPVRSRRKQVDDALERLVFHRRERVVEHDPVRRLQHHARERQRHLLVLAKLAIPTLGRVEALHVPAEAGALERLHVSAVCEVVRERRVGEHFAQRAAG